MRFHTFRASQWVPCKVGEVFEFFSDAKNLQVLTPPWLSFKVLSRGPIVIEAGARIEYQLRLHGLPIRWLTEIRQWKPNEYFSDTQLSGPYRFWHHTHLFNEENGGTRMRDVVRYSLGFGVFGEMANILMVRGDVEKIFAYRYKMIEERFGR
jgi:ligand-binding SRPBCC domain-containing protein